MVKTNSGGWLSILVNILLFFILITISWRAGYIGKVINTFSLQDVEAIENVQWEMRTSLFNELETKNVDAVFLGDSITEKCEWDEFFPDNQVVNRGIGSDTTSGVLERVDQISALNPKEIDIMIGINDLAQDIDQDVICKRYETILNRLNNRCSDAEIYCYSILPIAGEKENLNNKDIIALNTEVSKLVEEIGLTYVDLYSKLIDESGQLNSIYTEDGVHLNGNAYAIWIDEIKKVSTVLI